MVLPVKACTFRYTFKREDTSAELSAAKIILKGILEDRNTSALRRLLANEQSRCIIKCEILIESIIEYYDLSSNISRPLEIEIHNTFDCRIVFESIIN